MFRWTFPLLSLLLRAQALAQGFVPCMPYGGAQAVNGLVDQELHFPQEELEQGLKGSVFLIFSVMEDGALRDLRVWRGLTPACDAEALRIGALVRWHPATVGGVAHAAEHYLEIPFDAKRHLRRMEVRTCTQGFRTPVDSGLTIHVPSGVDEQPVPLVPNGLKGLPTYIAGNLRYPEDAYKRDLQGTVRLDFVVEPSGSISNLRALDELGGGCNEEAMRLVRSICWSPAVRDGRRVRCVQHLSIRFHIPPRTER